MAVYARVYGGVVQEIIQPLFKDDGTEWPIEDRYTPDLVAQMVEITGIDPQPQSGWTYNGVQFAPYVAPPPTDAEIIASNTAKLQQYTQLATAQKNALTARIGTLQDAIELEMATPAETDELPLRQAQLLEWKRYAVFLGRVTLQEGWALTVEWPAQPSGGMDLTVSAVAPESPQFQ